MRPFFSVIMCTYNRADLLPRAIASLQAQTETDWELIVVDDASTDATLHLVSASAAADTRIRYVRREVNGGTAAARNTGMSVAQGLFLTFLDSDDAYAPDHLATRKQMLLDHSEIHLLHGGVLVIGDPWVIDKDDPSRRVHIDDCVVGGTFVIRADVAAHLGPFQEGIYADDAHYFERACAANIVIAQTDHRSYHYYRNVPGQQTSTHAS